MRSLGNPLRVVIAGGGTGGHISPAIAVADRLRERMPVELHWIGSSGGFERDAARAHDIPFYHVRTGKLRRYIARATVVDAVRVPAGVVESFKLLKTLEPDVVFSTGGFVSTPTVVASRLCGIPSLTHEQTASVGLATRINARFCDIVALSYPGDGKIRTRKDTEIVVTGNPVRPSVIAGDRQKLLSLFDIPEDLPLLYVTGGVQGAHALNQAIAQALPELVDHVAIIHQCGPQSGNGDHARLVELREGLPAAKRIRYYPVERVGDELAHIYAAASMVLGRSGAGTVAELATVGLPSILVPLPGAEEQMRNARILEEAGAAVILRQDELTSERLIQNVRCIVTESERREAMRQSALNVAPDDPAGHLCDALIELAAKR
jgi:UDP-N-acetylglucosamine--N-acetylmuramyl-(pentapeptide) pyrophosphoryl-undecaprenol N-acetylglucosamine transferase